MNMKTYMLLEKLAAAWAILWLLFGLLMGGVALSRGGKTLGMVWWKWHALGTLQFVLFASLVVLMVYMRRLRSSKRK